MSLVLELGVETLRASLSCFDHALGALCHYFDKLFSGTEFHHDRFPLGLRTDEKWGKHTENVFGRF